MNPANNATTWANLVWESDLPAPAKLTAAALRTFMNSHTEMAWPSVGRLAKMTSQSTRTVQRHLKQLCERRFLLANGVSNVGTTRYLINVEGVTQSHPVTESPRHRVTGGVTESRVGGVTESPELNKELNNITKQDIDQIASDRPNETDFDLFWKAYPRKVGKPKAKAAFLRHVKTRETFNLALTNVAERIRCGEWEPSTAMNYIPHPTTWINRHGWDDVITPRESPGSNMAKARTTAQQIIDQLNGESANATHLLN